MTTGKNMQGKKNNHESDTVRYLYLFFVLCAIVVIGRIAYIQCCFRNSSPLLKYYTAQNRKIELTPLRGSILATDGRLLAISTPKYQIFMDCTVRKEEFSDSSNKKGPELEAEWRRKARELSEGLEDIYGVRSADAWYNMIIKARTEKYEGSANVKIGGQIDHETLQKVKALPLFREGSYKGGIIVRTIDTRQYPYGELARRTLGHIKSNSDPSVNNAVGLEGSFNHILHGKNGYEWTKKSDSKWWIINRDSTVVNPEDGMDIRTTIDIDIQDIADNALRTRLEDQPNIEGGCVIVMDVHTGAIRAMVNLLRDSTSGVLHETYNMAAMRAGEPGSVFKTAILMSLMEDCHVKLSDQIPTDHGKIGKFSPDQHIIDYERKYKTDKISVLHGYETSSNYVFRRLAMDNYGDNPQKLIDNLYRYRLGEAFNFDLRGTAAPYLPSPKSKSWSGTDLGSIAIGYNVRETPLHLVTFYNAIANRGKMMKPYLVEDIERHGDVKKEFSPAILNGSICSGDTADSLKRGLMMITEEGTAAKRLKNAKFKVAGKTGTARIVVEKNAMPHDPYTDKQGRKKYQGTFVGFFPAEAPRYTAIVVIYSKPSHEVFFGGTTPALTFRDIVDRIYAMDSSWGEALESRGRMPDMSVEPPQTAKNGKVPDIRGFGLIDAIYAIENDGYKCCYSGVGHVKSQSPAPGSALSAGGTVTIRLE